jgi:hypothetical protein
MEAVAYETPGRSDPISALVPHQFRHTFVTELLRAGVSFPGVMKLLGQSSPTVTMRYLGIALPDLQREFHPARSQPRRLAPQPKTPAPFQPPRADLSGLPGALRAAQHVLEMFHRTLPEGGAQHSLDRLGNRIIKIIAAARKLAPPQEQAETGRLDV